MNGSTIIAAVGAILILVTYVIFQIQNSKLAELEAENKILKEENEKLKEEKKSPVDKKIKYYELFRSDYPEVFEYLKKCVIQKKCDVIYRTTKVEKDFSNKRLDPFPYIHEDIFEYMIENGLGYRCYESYKCEVSELFITWLKDSE